MHEKLALGVIVELRVQGNIERREANPEYSLTWQAEMDRMGTTREQYDHYDENGDKAERRLPWVEKTQKGHGADQKRGYRAGCRDISRCLQLVAAQAAPGCAPAC